jgi:hypothetical protein
VIERCRDAFPVRLMCPCLRVSASGYYDWSKRLPCPRQLDNAHLLERMRELHEDSRGTLGAGRMREDLAEEGETVSLNRVARLMAADGLQGRPRPKRRGQRSRPALTPPGVRNLLERDFAALEPETKWVTDVADRGRRGDGDPRRTQRMAEQFRQQFQTMVDDSVRTYHRPYDLIGFLKRFINSPNRRLMIPFFWHRKFLKTAGYPGWMALGYKVPFGFPLVTLAHTWFERRQNWAGQSMHAHQSQSRDTQD